MPRCHPFAFLPFPKILKICHVFPKSKANRCNLIRSRPWEERTFERETRQRMARNFNMGEEVWVEEEWGIITAEESKQGALFPRSSSPPTSFLPRRVYESTSIREGQTSKVHRALPPFFRAPSLSSSTVAFHFLHPVGPFFAGGGQTYSKPGCNLSEHSRDNFQPDEARCFNRDIPLRRMLRKR